MRRGRRPEIKINEHGLYGFNLSSDATSEHEWGIYKVGQQVNKHLRRN